MTELGIDRCTGRTDCNSADQINQVVNQIEMEFIYTDYYFDSNDYSNPVKSSYNDLTKFYATPNLNKNVEIRMKRNVVSDQNSPFFYVPSEDYSFFLVEEVTENIYDSSKSSSVLDLKIVLDKKYQVINRQVYSLGDNGH